MLKVSPLIICVGTCHQKAINSSSYDLLCNHVCNRYYINTLPNISLEEVCLYFVTHNICYVSRENLVRNALAPSSSLVES
jgi:hypothetical protein